MLPGHTVRLRARLQRAVPLYPSLGPAGVTVAVEPGSRAKTGPGGWIDLELPPGRYTLCADRADPTTAVLAEVSPDRELFVSDIDRTLSDASSLAAAVRSNERLRPMPGAAEVLQRLGRRFQLVYLTARNLRYAAKTKAWLAAHEFPTAPLILRRSLWFRQPSRTYKHEIMAMLAQRWRAIRYGVGDRPGDVAAYAAVGATPVLIGSARKRSLPKGAIHVRSWKEIEERVNECG